jgi:excisionase family DNA binding protein
MTAASKPSGAIEHLGDYLTVRDFSVATGVSVETVRRRMASGALDHIATPLGRLIPRAALDRWLAEHARPAGVGETADAA